MYEKQSKNRSFIDGAPYSPENTVLQLYTFMNLLTGRESDKHENHESNQIGHTGRFTFNLNCNTLKAA